MHLDDGAFSRFSRFSRGILSNSIKIGLQCLLVVQKISTRSSDYLVGLLVGNSRLLLFLGERYMDFLYLERFFIC
jgi:hypothetical protein